ncbi:MAG: helix-turn-helix domain-containing protein [Eubacteriales bacterium]|nr:helix-turn-helix domain-containing protein [Eubacteriales bacterium]
MKLSMWMIANRLSSLLDIQTDIALDAKPILNSARMVYATNCVHVYQEGDYIVYDGEGDKIRIFNLTVKEAFEIVQGVFDYYQDWESQILDDIRSRNFQSMTDHCDLVFQNPMLLMNANYRLLAMSKGYPAEEMDDEWNYIAQYGYSSLNSIRQLRQDTSVDFLHEGPQAFNFRNIASLAFSGISYNLVFNEVTCGRMTLLAKNRPLNGGDYQLLRILARHLEPVLSIAPSGEPISCNALINLILGNPYSEHELELHLSYNHWIPGELYQVAVVEPESLDDPQLLLPLLMRTLNRQFPDSLSLIKDNHVILMANRELSKDTRFLELVPALGTRIRLKTGFSLPSTDYHQAAHLYQQAVHAILYGKQFAPLDNLYHFETYSIYYILDTPLMEDKLQACHPVICRLWEQKHQHHDELYDTLRTYLDNERSLAKTAAVLFTHRNTVLYRIKKCLDLLNNDLEDCSVRYYIRLSMHILENSAGIDRQKNSR